MIRILVVDDSAFSRKVITRILESIPDVQVIDTAVDGQDALAKCLKLRPDLITLDLEMPNMDGFTFLRWVMKIMPTPVIVISAKEADDNVFKAMDLGALDFIRKPTSHLSSRVGSHSGRSDRKGSGSSFISRKQDEGKNADGSSASPRTAGKEHSAGKAASDRNSVFDRWASRYPNNSSRAASAIRCSDCDCPTHAAHLHRSFCGKAEQTHCIVRKRSIAWGTLEGRERIYCSGRLATACSSKSRWHSRLRFGRENPVGDINRRAICCLSRQPVRPVREQSGPF